MNNRPLYLQIKQYIENKMSSGEWLDGHRITTEVELAKQFSVSRMTVNKAIRDLVNEGKLQRKPRLGTFVCNNNDKAESPLLDIRNIAEEVTQRGKCYSNKVVTQTACQADEAIAITLGIMIGDPIFFTEIIHFENNYPIQYELRWVNATYVPNYLKQNFSDMTPNHYLSQNCPLSAIEHTVEAIIADQKVRSALKLNANEPCLLLHRRTWSCDKLVSSAALYHPGARYKLSSKVMLS